MAKKKHKRVNPSRIAVTLADIKKAKADAIEKAEAIAWAIMLNVLRDKFNFDNQQLERVSREVNNLCDSIEKDYVDVDDLLDVLEEEAGIFLYDRK